LFDCCDKKKERKKERWIDRKKKQQIKAKEGAEWHADGEQV
jgi:hypothetical protein